MRIYSCANANRIKRTSSKRGRAIPAIKKYKNISQKNALYSRGTKGTSQLISEHRQLLITIEKLMKIRAFVGLQGKIIAQNHVRMQQTEAADNIELPPNRSVNQFPESSGALSSPSSFRKGECLMSSLLHKSL